MICSFLGCIFRSPKKEISFLILEVKLRSYLDVKFIERYILLNSGFYTVTEGMRKPHLAVKAKAKPASREMNVIFEVTCYIIILQKLPSLTSDG